MRKFLSIANLAVAYIYTPVVFVLMFSDFFTFTPLQFLLYTLLAWCPYIAVRLAYRRYNSTHPDAQVEKTKAEQFIQKNAVGLYTALFVLAVTIRLLLQGA